MSNPRRKNELRFAGLIDYVSRSLLQAFSGKKGEEKIQAFQEAEQFPGPSLIIAYSHCIAHGYGMQLGLEQQKLAVDSGHWPLFRYDPRRAGTGEPELKLDSPAPKIPLARYLENELRYRMLEHIDPAHARQMQASAQAGVQRRVELYQHLARLGVGLVLSGKRGDKT